MVILSSCDHLNSKSEVRRVANETIVAIDNHGHEYLQMKQSQQFLLSLSAGAFIAFGSVLSVVFSEGIEAKGLQKLCLSFGFATGFSMVIMSGSALYTEVNVILPILMFQHKHIPKKEVIKFWLLVYIGNFLGALFVASCIKGSDSLTDGQVLYLREIVDYKMREKNNGIEGWLRTLLSAVLGNWLVGMAAWNSSSARTVPGKFVGLYFPVISFASMGFQHSPANMGYLFVALIHGNMNFNWYEALVYNIIPSSIGNLFGAVILVALLFWYSFKTPNHQFNNNNNDNNNNNNNT